MSHHVLVTQACTCVCVCVPVCVLQNDLKSNEVSSPVILESLMKLDTRSRFSMNTTSSSVTNISVHNLCFVTFSNKAQCRTGCVLP